MKFSYLTAQFSLCDFLPLPFSNLGSMRQTKSMTKLARNTGKAISNPPKTTFSQPQNKIQKTGKRCIN